ncbi:MAG: PKD domain-containing protein [Methanoregula sp.]|nr:PKD domain-containing protein [Methanoregula sp.]
MSHGNLRIPVRFGLVLLLVLAVMVIPAMADADNSSVPDANLTVIETATMPPVTETATLTETATDVPTTVPVTETVTPAVSPTAEVTKAMGSNPVGSTSEIKTDTIKLSEEPAVAPIASFTASVTNGTVPMFVRFTDTSTNSPTSWVWDFNNDGTVDATTQNASYTYTTADTYTVNLTVTNTAGSNSMLKTDYVTVTTGSSGLADTPWPKYQHDPQNTGQSPFVGPQTNATRWNASIGTMGNVVTSYHPYTNPVIGSDGSVFTGGGFDTHIYRIYPNGTIKWDVGIGSSSDYLYGSMAIGRDGTLYFGDDKKYLYARSPDTGLSKWRAPAASKGAKTIRGSPAIGSDGTLYFASDGLYALDPAAGVLKWKNTTATVSAANYVSPAIGDDGTIYLGSESTKTMFAYNPDGTPKWSYLTGGAITGSAAIGTDGTIYFGSADNNVYALNPNGTLKWSYTAGGTFSKGTPAIGPDGTIYIGNYGDYKVYAFNPGGTPKWTYLTGGPIDGSPSAGADGTVYIGSNDNKIYALNPDGSLKWFYTTEGLISGSPSIGADGTLYIISKKTVADGQKDHVLYAFAGPVSFTADPTVGNAPLVVQFTGTSDLTATSWHWDFGDGTTSDEQNPLHTYTSAGSKSVNLTVTHSYGSTSYVQTAYITVYAPPSADFTSDVTSGKSPLTVQFTDASTGLPTSWLWDFGDGTTSTLQNPSHQYSTTGTDTVTYTVKLTATNAAGSNKVSKTGYITLYSNPPAVSFKASPRISTTAPLTVQFNDTSTLNPIEWLWDFGDGDSTNATRQNPVHTYATAGTYTVSLTATNAVGSNTVSKPGFITFVTPGPMSAYRNTNIYVANDEGVKRDVPDGISAGFTYNYIPNTYFVLFRSDGGGLNALSMTDDLSIMSKVVHTTDQSGIFYLAFGGGQASMNEAILMLAVNGTIPDDFNVHIRSSGYNWTPESPATENSWGPGADLNYVEGAVNQTFTKDDFIYGPQIWKPCSIADYPIFNGQNMSDTANTFQVMFIDLNIGALKSATLGPTNGAITVEYSFNNLTSFAAFNDYGWYSRSNHGTGMIMTNDVTYSGYTVTGIPAAPVAGFTSSTASSDIQSPVQFTDTSANVPQSWLWDFGDGTNSTVQNPTHTYRAVGTYTVKLTVTNIKGTDTMVKSNYITKIISPVPVANFTVNVTSGTYPLLVQFTDTSTNTPISWSWDFGDGTTSTEQNPTHWYGSGMFSINLTVTNSGGSNSRVKNNYVTVASSGSTNRFLNPGFETGTFDKWTVGTTATTINSSTYQTGRYAVEFPNTMSNDDYIEQYIDLTTISNLSFWGYLPVTNGNQKFYVYIDGINVQTVTGANSWTQYTIPIAGYYGVHRVRIQYSHYYQWFNAYIDDFVAEPAPTASFTATPVNGIAPLTVQFNDTSTGTPTSWLWDFGDVNTSTEQNATHTYTTAGTYTVNLTVTSLAGSTSLVKPGYISVGSHSGALPNYTGIFVRAANPEGIRWNANLNGTYYINQNGGGLNAVHISTDPTVNAGQVTESRNLSGTFYATESGGRGYQDEVVLLLAVNGTLPDDFSVHIKTSGYTWMPNVTANTAPPSGAYTHQAIALDETFTKKDFCYGPQNWKPQGANAIYPIFYGEDLTSPVNENQLMFIDTRAGVLGPNHADYASLTNNGAVKVEYSFNNLSGYAAFNIYAWNNATTQGQGMGWTNRVSGSGSSGYSVTTSTPIVAPIAAFTGTPTTGTAPLTVTFTDTSANIPTSWLWNFGDGSTATTQNATHTYTTAGTFTVNLTVTNTAGSHSLVRDKYISVQEAPADRARLILPAASLYQNTATQLPVLVMNITNGTGISFDLAYDPAVIRVNEITLNQSYASGSNMVINQTDGRIRLALTRTDNINIGSPVTVFFINTSGTGAVGLSTPLTLTNAMWGDGTFNYRTFNTMNGSALVYRYRGDLNGNTEVDIGDTAKTAYMVVEKTPHLIPDADFNNNGRIDVGDATKIAWYIVGKITRL